MRSSGFHPCGLHRREPARDVQEIRLAIVIERVPDLGQLCKVVTTGVTTTGVDVAFPQCFARFFESRKVRTGGVSEPLERVMHQIRQSALNGPPLDDPLAQLHAGLCLTLRRNHLGGGSMCEPCPSV